MVIQFMLTEVCTANQIQVVTGRHVTSFLKWNKGIPTHFLYNYRRNHIQSAILVRSLGGWLGGWWARCKKKENRLMKKENR